MTKEPKATRSRWLAGPVVLLASFLLASCSTATATARSSGHPRPRSVSSAITMAEPAAFAPDYIMPFEAGPYDTTVNVQVSELLWPTLYFFGSGTRSIGLNEKLSLAYPPVYSDKDSAVTVTLKHYKWSDGVALSSQDIVLFMNLLRANKDNWASYIPGNMPDDIRSYTAVNRWTVKFTLIHSYNPTWFTDDQLALIVPLPQQSWDRVSFAGKVGDYAATTKGAREVYDFLNSESKSVSTYDTDPLWKIVDGPWQLKTFDTNGAVTLVPNRRFSGPDHPKVEQFDYVPFTTDGAELDALLAGQLTVGYVPLTDLPALATVKSAGYSIVSSSTEAINFLTLNYKSPVIGPLVDQLYIRQVLNHLMDQQGQIKSLLGGSVGGYADYGPIPPEPPSPFESSAQKSDPYPFSVAKARKILVYHGWKIPSSGAAECERTGSDPTECGQGIARGEKLDFNLLAEAGVTYYTAEMEDYKSEAARAGVVINIRSVPFDEIISAICGNALCDSPGWEMATSFWSYGEPYPAGGNLFEGHVGLDYSPTAEFRRLLQETYVAPTSETISTMHRYDRYVISQAPVVWVPETYTINAVSSRLRGASFYPTNVVAPQNWAFVR